MDNKDRYQFYKMMKEKLNSIKLKKYGFFKIGNALSLFTWDSTLTAYREGKINNNEMLKFSIRLILKQLYRNTIKLQFKSTNKKIIMHHSSETLSSRADYSLIFNNVKNNVETDIIYSSRENTINLANLKYIGCIIYLLRLNFIDKLPLRLFFLYKIIEIIKVLDELNKLIPKNYRLFIAFCDAHEMDNILVQFLNYKGVTTATLQHGQYTLKKTAEECIDNLVYENFISDYIFCWGNLTRDIFISHGVKSERIKVLGCPKYFHQTDTKPSKIDKVQQAESQVFGILFNQELFKEENKILLEYGNKIAELLDLKYIVKMHPNNNYDDYKEIFHSKYLKEVVSNDLQIGDFVNCVNFSIVHLSASVYSELTLLLSPIFRYSDKNYFPYDFNYNEFTDIGSFMEKHTYFTNNKEEWYGRMLDISQQFHETGEIVTKYNKAINKLVKKNKNDR